jgi:hypothetical protein
MRVWSLTLRGKQNQSISEKHAEQNVLTQHFTYLLTYLLTD